MYKLKIINCCHLPWSGRTTVTLAKDDGFSVVTALVSRGRIVGATSVYPEDDELHTRTRIDLTPEERTLILSVHLKKLRAHVKDERRTLRVMRERNDDDGCKDRLVLLAEQNLAQATTWVGAASGESRLKEAKHV